jgi:diguanylate cyclase (GGDEF)-like protein
MGVMPVTDPAGVRDHLREAWYVAIAMYLGGALALLTTLAAPDPDTSDHGALLIFAAFLAATGGALALIGPRRIPLMISDGWGVLGISAFIAVAEPIAATPFFYMWPILHAAYFFGRRAVAINLVLVAGGFGAVLAIYHDPGDRQLMWTGTVFSMAVLAGVMTVLKERIDRLVAQLRESSATDPLTGLLNRRAFSAGFDSELKQAIRAGAPLALVAFDIDHFKEINDRHGHVVGDRALCRLAELLRREQREGDLIARIGGDEFAVLLVDADGEAARSFALRVASSPHLMGNGESPISVSAGLATLGVGSRTQDAILLAADSALYDAKDAGRGRVAIHGGGVTVVSEPRLAEVAARAAG